MALIPLTADDYGLLANAAAASDGRFRYAPPGNVSHIAGIQRRIQEGRDRMVKAEPALLIVHPGRDPNYPDFEITEAGRQLVLDQASGPAA